MKWALYIVFGLAIVFGWAVFVGKDKAEIERLTEEIEHKEKMGYQDDQELIFQLQDRRESLLDGKKLTGILMSFLTAGLIGIFFVIDILPIIAHKMTHAVYDSGEMVEDDPMHDARSKLAQGDYEGAIGAFRDAAAVDPMNRVPYVEIAKIQREQMEDPASAIKTLRDAIENQEWQLNDAAFLMFRLAEVYDEDMEDRKSSASIMQQVMEQFPDTRHSANARHKLHEWGLA